MSSVNQHLIIGRLGKDPELRTTSTNKMVATFSVATSESYTDQQGQKKEIVDWHNIVVWGKTAEVAHKFLKKGNIVCIQGKSRSRSWEKEGKTYYTTEVICDNLTLLPNGATTQRQEYTPPPPEDDPFGPPTVSTTTGGKDDLPF